MQTEQWFLDRVWKTIYRDQDNCICHTCQDVVENGINVEHEDHATYLYEIQNEWWAEWIILNYRDKK